MTAPPVLTVEPADSRNGKVPRVHIAGDDGRRTLCGCCYPLGKVRTAPHPLPEGAGWCPVCLGFLAARTGRTRDVAAVLGLEAGERS